MVLKLIFEPKHIQKPTTKVKRLPIVYWRGYLPLTISHYCYKIWPFFCNLTVMSKRKVIALTKHVAYFRYNVLYPHSEVF